MIAGPEAKTQRNHPKQNQKNIKAQPITTCQTPRNVPKKPNPSQEENRNPYQLPYQNLLDKPTRRKVTKQKYINKHSSFSLNKTNKNQAFEQPTNQPEPTNQPTGTNQPTNQPKRPNPSSNRQSKRSRIPTLGGRAGNGRRPVAVSKRKRQAVWFGSGDITYP